MPEERFDYKNERQRHEKFVGRKALMARLDELLVDDGADRWVVVTGGPGMGKSAILSAWLTRREAAGAVVPHHFIRRGAYDWDDPAQMVGSLVAQIDERFPGARELDTGARMHPAARLAKALSRVSERELGPRGERLVVLIDGLDEYDAPAGALPGDPLAAFLPHALPRGVSFLCASRPRHPYVSSLEARHGEFTQLDLDGSESVADNDATVRAFWEDAAGPLGLDTHFIDEAVARAGGNVQHAVQLRRHVAATPAQLRRVEDIPRGLEALIERTWERIAHDTVVVEGLGILCAAREALTLDELGAVANWTADAPRRAFLRGAKEILVETQRPDGQREYRLHHDSIRAHMAQAIGDVALRGHHRALAQRLATWPAPAQAVARRYALRHALIHRVEADAWADAWRIAGDTSFLEVKCRELGAHDVEADVTRIAERSRAGGDSTVGHRFSDLARALVRESHWLRAAPEVTAAVLWNRLRRSGWSELELSTQLQVPVDAAFLRVRHTATRESPDLVRDLVGHSGDVSAYMVTPDGLRVVSASGDQTLKVWDLESGRARASLKGHANLVSACVVTPDGRSVVSASRDKTLKVWDLESGRALATLEGHAGWVRACAVTPDGRRVVSASTDQTLKVWDLESGRALATLEGHVGKVTACAVTPNGRRVVSASQAGTLKVWDLESGRALATLEGHASRVIACVVTPDGRRIVSASDDGTLKVWDLESGRALATLEGHAGKVTACAVTPNGRCVVSASRAGTLKVWDLEGGRALATLEGHASRVIACVVTPDGRRVVSASDDKTLKVWDLATYACLFTHRGDAPYLAVAADTAGVVAGDSTGGIWFLDWPPSDRRATQLGIGNRENRQHESRPAQETSLSRPTMKKHTILFLAANPTGTSPLALGEEVRAIQAELERSGYRDWFELETRWAAQPLDLLRELRRLKPTVVHFSGHGGPSPVGTGATSRTPSRDVSAGAGPYDNEPQRGLFFQGPDGRAQLVTAQALDETFSAAGSSVKLVVLSACYSDMQAEALRAHVDCVVGMSGSIVDDAARNFAIGFYGGLGERESIAAAFRQGCAAISLEGLRDSDRPQLRVRDGVDASKLVLGFPSHVEAHDTGAVGVQPQTHRTSSGGLSSFVHKVDIGILTIRDDEFRAVLDAFPQKAGAGVHKAASRQYILRHAEVATGDRYTVAILRQMEQGTGEAQHAARDLIEDLAPKLVLVVGIAGGLPSDDVTLGDVVLGIRIHDYTVEAVKTGHEVKYAATGGPIDMAIAAAVVALAGRKDELGDWTSGLPSQPTVAWTEDGQVYGPPEWQRELRAKLEHHFAGGASQRAPTYMSGAIASSDRLVKDPTMLFPWITTARNLLAVEMESGGVYRAARERCPMLAIRGISDMVGLKRADAWTKFACASAAAFARAFLRTQPVPVGASLGAADPL